MTIIENSSLNNVSDIIYDQELVENNVWFNFKTSYLESIFAPGQYKKTLNRAISKMKYIREKHGGDVIAFQGASGSALAYTMGYMLDMPLIHIRKKRENSHYIMDMSGCNYEGYMQKCDFIILDDFISCGETVKNILDTVKEYNSESKCVGILLYNICDAEMLSFKYGDTFLPKYGCIKLNCLLF